MRHRSITSCLWLAIALQTITGTALGAQLPKPKLGISAGVSSYSLGVAESNGTSAIGALRLDLPLVLFVVEGSFAAFRPSIAGETHTYIIPEVQVQWQFAPLGVRPYLGAGVGWFHPMSGPSITEVTYSGSAGVRGGIPFFPLSLRAEARHRILGSSFSRHATELTVGVSW